MGIAESRQRQIEVPHRALRASHEPHRILLVPSPADQEPVPDEQSTTWLTTAETKQIVHHDEIIRPFGLRLDPCMRVTACVPRNLAALGPLFWHLQTRLNRKRLTCHCVSLLPDQSVPRLPESSMQLTCHISRQSTTGDECHGITEQWLCRVAKEFQTEG
jgi:hypothetical protein